MGRTTPKKKAPAGNIIILASNARLEAYGRNIAKFRAARGMSQYDLADALEVRHPTVWRWEKGRMEPRWKHKVALAEVLNTTIGRLFPNNWEAE